MATLKAMRESQRKLDELAAEVRESVKPLAGWIKCSDRLPDLEGKPDHSCSELVIAFTEFRTVKPLRYVRQMYNRTENGRQPRWEDLTGRIAPDPTHWQPLPAPPTE